MAPIKKEKESATLSEFARRRQENVATNSALLKDITTTAQKLVPTPKAPKPKSTTTRKKKTPAVKKEPTRIVPTRRSLRNLNPEDALDEETAKRKAEQDLEFAAIEHKAKRIRVTGDLALDALMGDDKKGLLSGLVRGADPYVRTFTEDDIKETTDENLKALRESMNSLELYEDFTPNEIKLTPQRIYSLGFLPDPEKPIIFAGDKEGTLGIFDASQGRPKVEDDEEEDDSVADVKHLKLHTRTITSMVFPSDGQSVFTSSYDSQVRRLDLNKEISVEIYAPASSDDEMGISCIAIPENDPNTLYFTTLEGQLGKRDIRSKDVEIWQIRDKKIGGFSLHPLYPHLAATASNDRMLQIWDLRNVKGKGDNRLPALMGEHESRLSVSHASWSAAGHIATSSYDDTIKIHSLLNSSTFKIGHEIDEEDMNPISIKHNNQVGRWVTILKPQWQARPDDGIQKFVIGNMNRFVDVFSSDGEQLAQLSGEGITAVPAVAHFHPSRNWVAAGTASGKLCLWL